MKNIRTLFLIFALIIQSQYAHAVGGIFLSFITLFPVIIGRSYQSFILYQKQQEQQNELQELIKKKLYYKAIKLINESKYLKDLNLKSFWNITEHLVRKNYDETKEVWKKLIDNLSVEVLKSTDILDSFVSKQVSSERYPPLFERIKQEDNKFAERCKPFIFIQSLCFATNMHIKEFGDNIFRLFISPDQFIDPLLKIVVESKDLKIGFLENINKIDLSILNKKQKDRMFEIKKPLLIYFLIGLEYSSIETIECAGNYTYYTSFKENLAKYLTISLEQVIKKSLQEDECYNNLLKKSENIFRKNDKNLSFIAKQELENLSEIDFKTKKKKKIKIIRETLLPHNENEEVCKALTKMYQHEHEETLAFKQLLKFSDNGLHDLLFIYNNL